MKIHLPFHILFLVFLPILTEAQNSSGIRNSIDSIFQFQQRLPLQAVTLLN
ncbi:MAG: hypothetical protein KA954_07805 [Chitinophagales bacterium]|nr:hypothetical protein [Chitinophagales bacterium]